jgi:hypothetical protein
LITYKFEGYNYMEQTSLFRHIFNESRSSPFLEKMTISISFHVLMTRGNKSYQWFRLIFSTNFLLIKKKMKRRTSFLHLCQLSSSKLPILLSKTHQFFIFLYFQMKQLKATKLPIYHMAVSSTLTVFTHKQSPLSKQV